MRKLIVAAIAIWWLWPHHHRDPVMQVAATPTDFVAREGRDVVLIDAAAGGTPVGRITPDVPDDFRVVGTRDGLAVGWLDGGRVALALLADDGARRETTYWGSSVERLCDGVASNGARFAIAWAERDGSIMFVHGPVSAASVAPKSWCGIASAGEHVALFWRDSGRTFLNFCSRTSCEGRVLGLPIERRDALIGYGCVDTACLLAVRHPDGGADLVQLDARGRMQVRPLETSGDRVAITGVGSEAFAIAYLQEKDWAHVERIGVDGTRRTLFHLNEPGLRTPQLAWAHGFLLGGVPYDDVFYFAVPLR